MDTLRKIFKEKKLAPSLAAAAMIGIMLMIMGGDIFGSKEDKTEEKQAESINDNRNNEYEDMLERRLENIFGEIEGVGRIKVMVTVENRGEIVVDKEKNSEEENESGERGKTSQKREEKTVVLNNSEPLVLKENEPRVSGILIICEGGDNVEIKKSLMSAAEALLNIEVHKIEVLKMK
ncbi:MAG: hypothetical protein IJ583_17225 [Firmicutes bacterium]|nr:hypothetical protein [Bacillota bacterium]